jgi:glycosyltransferase involved in cell wall biosynthesis
MHVAVIIPCRNEVNYIGACVRAALSQEYPADRLKVYVVDGMSDDGTRELVHSEFQHETRVVLLDNPQRTTPNALNIGIMHAQADVAIIFGAHAEMMGGYVDRCVHILSNDHSVGCVGGVIDNVNENEAATYISQCMSSSFGVGNAHFRTGTAVGYVDTVAFGAYRSTIFHEVGYFDPALVRNQDDEFNYRLTKFGWKIYLDPTIRSRYHVRGSLHKLTRQYYQYGYWKVYVNAIHKTITTWRQLIPFLFVTYLAMAVLACALAPTGAGLWLLPLLLYIGISVKVSMSFGGNLKDWLYRMLVFFVLHFSYGRGYAVGILRFLLLRKVPAAHATTSSR